MQTSAVSCASPQAAEPAHLTLAPSAPRVHSIADVRRALGFWMRLNPVTVSPGRIKARCLGREASHLAGVLGVMYFTRANCVADDELAPAERTCLYSGLVFDRMSQPVLLLTYTPASAPAP